MKCPVHDELLPEEYADGWWTAFCLKCPKRYRLCHKVFYMHPCQLIENHEGWHEHRDYRLSPKEQENHVTKWLDDPDKPGYYISPMPIAIKFTTTDSTNKKE